MPHHSSKAGLQAAYINRIYQEKFALLRTVSSSISALIFTGYLQMQKCEKHVLNQRQSAFVIFALKIHPFQTIHGSHK